MSGGSSGALRGWICLVAAVWIGGAGQAEETGTNLGESVQIHGFGGWAFGSSSPWPYLTGRGGGEAEYENGEFALNISAQPSNRLHVAAQFFWEVTPDGTEEIEMDYAFAEWSFSDRLRLRAGQVKFPFGIYGEILDVGTLRPFFTLPQSIYGDNELESEAYLGLGVTGSKDLGSGWRLAYDIYGGGLDLEVGESLTDIFEGGAEEELPGDEQGRREKVENLVGGRISFTSPSGISLGLSVHTGEVLGDEAQGEAGSSWGEEVSYGLFVEYLGDLWQIRSEVGYRRDLDDPDFQGVYLEAGYNLTDDWQLVGRLEAAELDRQGAFRQLPSSLIEHREAALGLNYWFTSDLVIKVSYHEVQGNLFARPEEDELLDLLERGELDDATSLVVFGVQFSF